ncbi:L-cysteine desulfidase family protein [Sunxiuqinia indica]|uniref:L-cysteine desulfidase family protein n=1 Tax=Sunxiuqinia indica TaxID=2692584 RepID=UPI0013579950|nr:L-serine ammonia-lyase, iron-sulfur-dependent, subunit alpha [Sunxiuqinia indica]
MEKTDLQYSAYLNIIREELIPAMGCTEPMSIAYSSAVATKILEKMPERVLVEASDNIIKNVKSVVVPNTGGLKGIEVAAVAGIISGDAAKVLEVISSITEEERLQMRNFLETNEVKVTSLNSEIIFDLRVTVFSGAESASVQISHFHTNIVRITKNNKSEIYKQDCNDITPQQIVDRSFMSVAGILDFAESVEIAEVKDLLEKQVSYNTAIANEGIKNNWGANIGSVLLNSWGTTDIKVRAKAMAAAGSDARMSGCGLPVMIVAGSGNQGLTASLPVIEYANELNVDRETLYRGLIVANLITIHQKTRIGRLSAYCGAISAGVGAGAGITWLHGGRLDEVAHTIVNALAIVSGIICDGAKPSCAGKIASAVEAGILGYHMYKNGQQFYGGDGIVKKGVENTIENIGQLASKGMRETDKEIIRIMLGE